MEALVYLFAGFFIVLGFLLLVGLVLHVLMALGLHKIVKREGLGDHVWLAWIPFVNTFLLTLLVEDEVREYFQGKLTLVYGLSLIVSVFMSGILPFVGLVPLGILLYAFYYVALRYSKNEVVHLVIAALTGFVGVSISLFLFRNRGRVDEEVEVEVLDVDEV